MRRTDYTRSQHLRDLRADLVNQAMRDGVVVDENYFDALSRAITVLEQLQAFVHNLGYHELKGVGGI